MGLRHPLRSTSCFLVVEQRKEIVNAEELVKELHYRTTLSRCGLYEQAADTIEKLVKDLADYKAAYIKHTNELQAALTKNTLLEKQVERMREALELVVSTDKEARKELVKIFGVNSTSHAVTDACIEALTETKGTK